MAPKITTNLAIFIGFIVLIAYFMDSFTSERLLAILTFSSSSYDSILANGAPEIIFGAEDSIFCRQVAAVRPVTIVTRICKYNNIT